VSNRCNAINIFPIQEELRLEARIVIKKSNSLMEMNTSLGIVSANPDCS